MLGAGGRFGGNALFSPPMRALNLACRKAGCIDTLRGHQASEWTTWEEKMSERQVESVYRIVDVVGESPTSWEEAGRHAVETAATSIRDLRVAEVVKMDMKVENGKVTAFRTRVALSFKYETS
jgi:dodecin